MKKITQYGADWCQVCKSMTPIVEAVALELGVKYVYIDVDTPDGFQAASEIGVMSVPVTVIQNGDDVLTVTGGCSQEDLMDVAQRVMLGELNADFNL